MKLILDSDARLVGPKGEDPYPTEYKNVKAFCFFALTEENGRYFIETNYGFGDLTSEEYDNAKLQTLVSQFGLYWQDAKMWLKELNTVDEK